MRTKLGIKKTVLALAVLAVGVIAIPSAQSASTTECLGLKPNVIGTRGNDVIRINTDEDGSGANVNGRWLEPIYERVVVFAGGGNDRIVVESTGPIGVRVCAGDGNDSIEGEDMARIHAGSGYDTVRQHIICHMTPEVFAAEVVRSSDKPRGDPANCFEGGTPIPRP